MSDCGLHVYVKLRWLFSALRAFISP